MADIQAIGKLYHKTEQFSCSWQASETAETTLLISCSGNLVLRIRDHHFFRKKYLIFDSKASHSSGYLSVTAQPKTSPSAPAIKSNNETVRAPVKTA